jgi:hypothetical protein
MAHLSIRERLRVVLDVLGIIILEPSRKVRSLSVLALIYYFFFLKGFDI